MNDSKYQPGDILIPHEEIQKEMEELALEIAKKYKGQKLIVVGILKGAFKLTADLTSKLHEQGLTDLEISFIFMRSYSGTNAGERLEILQDMDVDPRGRHVLIIDDILDSGRSLKEASDLIKLKGAASVESFVLLDKKEGRVVEYEADYVCFKIPKVWVQGFGMDTDGIGRADKNVIVGPYKY
jgi:hypoxanthine phosphoribosyltransferase